MWSLSLSLLAFALMYGVSTREKTSGFLTLKDKQPEAQGKATKSATPMLPRTMPVRNGVGALEAA